MCRLRLFIDPSQDGPTNMAVDGCLLAEAGDGGPATLRLYRWAPATLSLGRFQHLDDPARRDPALAELPVVRRCTGGGAIVHADELTYCLALPIDHHLAGRRPADLYTWMHARIAEAVARLGGRAGQDGVGQGSGSVPFLCFRRHGRFDLMAGADKLAGSAQRRTKRAALQHGSIILRRTHPRQPSAAVSDLVGREVVFETLAGALATAIGQSGVTLTEAEPTRVDPRKLRAQLRLHTDPTWLRRR